MLREWLYIRPRRTGNSSPRRAADIETSTGLLLACPRSAGFGQHLFVDDLQTKPASLLPIHGTTTLYAPRPFGWLLLTAVPSSSVDGTGSGAETTQSTHDADRTLRCSRPARPVMQALWLYSRCVSLFLWFLTTPRLIPGRGCEAQHDTSRHRERTFSRAGAARAAPIPVLLKKKMALLLPATEWRAIMTMHAIMATMVAHYANSLATKHSPRPVYWRGTRSSVCPASWPRPRQGRERRHEARRDSGQIRGKLPLRIARSALVCQAINQGGVPIYSVTHEVGLTHCAGPSYAGDATPGTSRKVQYTQLDSRTIQ